MNMSLKNYTLRYIIIAFLVIMALWASLFYAYILDEVYDNVDDGLKSQKIEIIREVYENPDILQTKEFGVNQFRVLPADPKNFSQDNRLSNEFFYMPYDEEEEPYRVLRTGFYTQDGTPYHLEIRTSTVEEDDLIYDLTSALVVLYVVLLGSLYIINEVVLRKAWKPFNMLLDNLNHYRFGKSGNQKPIHTNVKEFNQLNQGINDMWKRNERIFDEQKLFIENASHELQTPLAITINKLELLMEDNTLSEEQLVQLAESKDALQRLVNLNKALLMLSRIENKQYKNVTLVNFNALITRIVEDFEDLISFKNIKLIVQEKGIFECMMNEDLATVLLSNLMRNAIKYNKQQGEIEIEIEHNRLSIKNTGVAFALEPSLVFRRFHKGVQDSQSNGLGLAIVKSIVDSYKSLQIGYRFEGDRHLFFLTK